MSRFLVSLAALWFAASAHAAVELGVGGMAGGAFYHPTIASAEPGMSFLAAGSPMVSGRLDPWETPVRAVFGVWSAPTFGYSMGYDAYTAPIVVVEAGLTAGSDTTHATVMAHAGLLSFGAGAGVTHTPWRLGRTAHTGFEVRASWLARYGVGAGALWVTRFGDG